MIPGVSAADSMRSHVLLCAVAVLSFAVVGESVALADGQVHDLDSSSFSDALKANSFSFVEFYAPWCGHCKKLVPEWEKTAQLSKDKVMIAKVDAIAEKTLAQENEVQSFPTLKLFKGGPKVSVKYEGPRTGEKMAEWAKGRREAQLLQHTSASDFQSWASKKSVALLGLLSGDDGNDAKMRHLLEDVSFALNPKEIGGDVPVATAEAEAAILQELGISEDPKLPKIALIRDFEFEDKVVFFSPQDSLKKSYDPLMKWTAANRVPALIPGSEQTEKFFLQEIEPGNGLLLYFGEVAELQRGLHELAVQFLPEKKLKWVHLKNNDFGESLGKSVSITKADFPEVALWEFGETEDEDKVFRLSQQSSAGGLTKASVEAFVKEWQQGSLSAEKDPVTSVTSDTFESIVINNERDVLVEFYAPWCGHCKALAPEYKLVAQHYANDIGVEIVKMDATKHKHSSADIKSYPTLKLYKKGKKSSPVDGEFKSTRNKAGIIEFIEKNRASGPKEGKGSKKDAPTKKSADETKSEPQAAPSKLNTAASQSPLPQAAGSYWIFDDALEPHTRGKELSSDMVSSLNGFTLVQVGDIGLLLSPGSDSARAVRRFPDALSVKTYMERTKLTGAPAPGNEKTVVKVQGNLSCPPDASLHSCKAWCEGVCSGDDQVRTTFGGKSCSELSASPAAHERPSCMCYDSEYRVQLAMCISPCGGGDKQKVQSPGTCAAGDATCSEQQANTASSKDSGTDSVGSDTASAGSMTVGKRFLLYDTKYGEGFNLQREVYPRAGWVVAEVNKALDTKCGSKTNGACARWVLVLPPWCQVVHWWSGPDHVHWRTFFDSKALNSSKVPVIEFDAYATEMGRQRVDLAVTFETDKLKGQKDKLKQGTGKFAGFADNLVQCATKYTKPLEFQKLKSGEKQIIYAGHCEGGLAAKDLKCAGLDGPWPQGVADMVSSLDSSVSSVLLKNYDYLLAPDNEQLDSLGLRESMYFSQELRSIGDNFIQSALRGEKYLAAHCRRTDFLRAREKTTPDVSNIAAKLNEVLEQQGLKQVFIATDAQEDLRAELQMQVKGTVIFYDSKNGATNFDHKGKQAIVETWIAARADFFIGTIESRFTMSIQLERSFLGKNKKTSEQEFCKDYKPGGKPCLAPSYRHRASHGVTRAAYLS